MGLLGAASKAGFYYIAQAGLELEILLPQTTKSSGLWLHIGLKSNIFGSEDGLVKAVFREVFLIELLFCEVSKIILASSLSGPRPLFSKSLPNEACLFLSLSIFVIVCPSPF